MGDRIDLDGGDPERRARNALMRHLDGDQAAARSAMELYDGIYESMAEYVRRELEEHLPPFLDWIPDFLDLDAVGQDWLTKRRNFTLPDRKTGGVHVFLSCDPLHPPDR